MKGSHSGRKSESEGKGSGLIDNFVGAKVLLRQFLCRTSGFDVLRVKHNLVTYLEVRGRRSSLVRIVLISLLGLCYFGLEHLMKLVEVHSKIPSASGRNVTFRMNGDVRMITLIGEKG